VLDFLNVLANPWILITIISPVVLFLGLFLGNWLSQPRKNVVLKLDPQSHRGVSLQVREEDAVTVYCDRVGKMPPQKFIKRLNPYNILQKGWLKLSNFAMWFGRYGTAYVHEFKDELVNLEFADVVHHMFGEKYYKQIPDDVKKQIENAEVGVLVEFPINPLTPKDQKGKLLPSISEDDIRRDDDEKAMKNLTASIEKETRRDMLNILAVFGAGIGAGIVVSLVMKWGAPVEVVNKVVKETSVAFL